MDLTATPARRRTLFALLYLIEGAPIGFLWWALPTLLRERGLPLADITALTAMLGLPWTLKVLGAPLVDLARSSGLSLRLLLVTTQLVMVGALLPLTAGDSLLDLELLPTLLLLHAVAAAMQDVTIDALCLSVTPPAERGAVNGWMQAGMLVGRGAFGGGALLAASHWGEAAPVRLLVGLLIAFLLVLPLAVPARAGAHRAERPLAELRRALASTVRQSATWRSLLFAAVAAAGFEAVGAVAGPFLVDRGLSAAEIGGLFDLPKVAAMATGALLGGWLADRWGPERATRRSQTAFAALVLVLAGLDASGLRCHLLLLAALLALYAAIGVFTAASYALLMNLTTPRLAATQFSAYMGATNACENWAMRAVGQLEPALGYAAAFALMAAVSLFALPLVPRAAASLARPS